MFNIQLVWDRPIKLASRPSTHCLRIRFSPNSGNKPSNTYRGIPLRLAIALDTSSSMEGKKLEAAQKACLTVLSLLRPEDRFWLAGFSTKIHPLINGLVAENSAIAAGKEAISKIKALGITRFENAMDWLAGALKKESNSVHVGVLITDGHPTDMKGNPLADKSTLLKRAERLWDRGIMIETVGYGASSNFNTTFLVDLSQKGNGTFIYAQDPEELEPRLRQEINKVQNISAEDVVLKINPLYPGLKLSGICRLKPSFLPFDNLGISTPIKIGALSGQTEGDFLISFEVPALNFGENMGMKQIAQIEATSLLFPDKFLEQASLNFTNSMSEANQLEKGVDQDRLLWDINLYSQELNRTDQLDRTVDLLQNIVDSAIGANRPDLRASAVQRLDELKKTGLLRSEGKTRLLDETRNGDKS
ncbi:MAG: VWA domain-containing protein [Candidatus Riflebacteria bacterium]|nr:VWA domain-containing protein [Candidatus Riflebacteria bacterium]